MTLSFRPGMSACAFITDGFSRYLKEHRAEEPVELVLHPEHNRALRDELHMRHAGVMYDGYCFNNIREPYAAGLLGWSLKMASAGSSSSIITRCG
jgi:hypothetical protein